LGGREDRGNGSAHAVNTSGECHPPNYSECYVIVAGVVAQKENLGEYCESCKAYEQEKIEFRRVSRVIVVHDSRLTKHVARNLQEERPENQRCPKCVGIAERMRADSQNCSR